MLLKIRHQVCGLFLEAKRQPSLKYLEVFLSKNFHRGRFEMYGGGIKLVAITL